MAGRTDKTKSFKDNNVAKWFRGIRSEFKKIVWPTPKQTANNTFIVIAFVIICGAFIAVLDILFNWGILNWFIKK